MEGLPAKTKAANECGVARGLFSRQVHQQPPAVAHKLEQATAAVVVHRVGAQVPCQVLYVTGDQGYLDLRGPRVFRVSAVFGDGLLLTLPVQAYLFLW
jgi:hypothetical protein